MPSLVCNAHPQDSGKAELPWIGELSSDIRADFCSGKRVPVRRWPARQTYDAVMLLCPPAASPLAGKVGMGLQQGDLTRRRGWRFCQRSTIAAMQRVREANGFFVSQGLSATQGESRRCPPISGRTPPDPCVWIDALSIVLSSLCDRQFAEEKGRRPEIVTCGCGRSSQALATKSAASIGPVAPL